MIKYTWYIWIIVGLAVLMPIAVNAQLNQGGIPLSFSLSMAPFEGDMVSLAPPDTDLLLQEDEQAPLPYRFAINLPVDLGIASSGRWETAPNGTKIWRLNIKSPGAQALTLYFDQFHIPEGGKLFVYNPGRTQWLGAFTERNNNDLSTFATGLIYGDQLTLEYDASASGEEPLLHISEIAHAYRGVAQYSNLKTGFGSSGKCEVNVKCSEGDAWYNQKRGVARIEVKKGTSSVWCTGSLVNNTKNDATPYVLLADHCGVGASTLDISKWIFYFNYESATCPNPQLEPGSNSLTGATLVAHSGFSAWKGSDFFLALLNDTIPRSFNAYFNGWSREATASPSGTCIHHPAGDIKKISTYTSHLRPAYYPGNTDLAFWQVTWSGTPNGHGTTEGGSSGSPIFDNLGRIVGTLTGGDSGCDSAVLNSPDYYGMFSYHWDKNGTDAARMLKPWLDPINADVMSLNGWAVSVGESPEKEVVNIYPNPTSDIININWTHHEGSPVQIVLSDLFGNILLNQVCSNPQNQESQVNLSGFPKGIYIVSLSDGRSKVVRKIVKL